LAKIELSISIILYEQDIAELSGLLYDIKKINLCSKLYILDNSPLKIDLSSLVDDSTEIIYSSENLGYGKGHNACIERAIKAGSQYHLIINPDVRFNGEDIRELYEFMEENEDVGMLIPSVTYEDGSFQYIYKLLPDPLTLFSRYGAKFLPKSIVEKLNFHYEMRHKDFSKPFELPVVSGCFMFCRTKALEDVGGFDDRFFMYMEDVDLSRRISHNYKNIYYPYVQITHGFSKASFKNFRMMRAHIASVIKYFNKWGWFFDPERRRINSKAIPKN